MTVEQTVQVQAGRTGDAPPKRALFIKFKHLGDSVIATAAIDAMPQGWEIDVVCFSASQQIFEMHPRVARVETTSKGKRGVARFLSDLSLVSRLKARRYDFVAQFSDDWRGAILSRLISADMSVARRNSRRGRLWHSSFKKIARVPSRNPRHMAELDVDLVRIAGLYSGSFAPPLRIVPDADAVLAAARASAQANLIADDRPLVLIQPATRWSFKGLPIATWTEAIDEITAAGQQVALLGGPDDRDLLDRIAADAGSRIPILIADIKTTAALMLRSSVVVSVDSLAMHLAAAVGRPTVAVFGPTDEGYWKPWGVPHRLVVNNEYSCRPCNLDGCAGSKVSHCLIALPPSRIPAAVFSLLMSLAADDCGARAERNRSG